MCSAVLARFSLCNTLRIAQPDDRFAPDEYGKHLVVGVKTDLVRKLSVRCGVPRQICLVTQNFPHEFCPELWAHVLSLVGSSDSCDARQGRWLCGSSDISCVRCT